MDVVEKPGSGAGEKGTGRFESLQEAVCNRPGVRLKIKI